MTLSQGVTYLVDPWEPLIRSLAILAALLASLHALYAAYLFSPEARARRTAGRAIGRLRRHAGDVASFLKGRGQAIREASAPFVEQQKRADVFHTPLSELKTSGTRTVRWSALEEAGLRTLGDLAGHTSRSLDRVPGVGAVTAREVLKRARAQSKRIRRRPPRPPRPDLSEAEARPVGRACLDGADAFAEMGPLPARLRDARADLRAQAAELDRRARFRTWLLGAAGDGPPVAQTAAGIRAEADALIERDSFSAVRKRLVTAARQRGRADDATLRDEFERRYVECCSAFDRAVVGRGRRRHGWLNPELVEKIERHPLRLDALGVQLRAYQEFGAKFILAQESTVLGDEMGLGKTIQALAAMAHLHAERPPLRAVVVAPASIIFNWANEIESKTSLPCFMAHGSDRDETIEGWIRDGGVLVVSYSTLRNLDLAQQLDAGSVDVDLLVADEAHYVKNPDAMRSLAVDRLAARAGTRCLMTGTPMENHPREFRNLLCILDEQFEDLSATGTHDRKTEFLTPEDFHDRISTAYLRRNQEDVLTELPEKIETEEWVELHRGERAAYRDAVREGNFMKMRRFTTVGGLEHQASAKLEHLDELLESHREEQRKVLVFSYFLDVLAAIERRYAASGIVAGRITGALGPDERRRIISSFQQRPGHGVLLGQIVAAGVGLNLQAASAVVIMEPQLKPTLEEQAIARAYRMGQTRRLLVHRLLATDTVDGRIRTLLAEKSRLFAQYADDSLIKHASGQAMEAGGDDGAPAVSAVSRIIEMEQQRDQSQ